MSVRAVLDMEGLGLEVVGGAGGLGNSVTGAHSTEHPDPRQWLHGGELLMTTGMRMRRRPDWPEFLERLVGSGVSALAFSTGPGLTFQQVPSRLVAAADAAGMPLITVPVTTPFTTITEAVYSALAAEQEAGAMRAFAAQRRLISSAVGSPGINALAEELATMVGGAALIFDRGGELLFSTLPSGTPPPEAVVRELPRIGAAGLRSSASVTLPDDSCAYVVPLGAHELSGMLACIEPARRFSTFARHCATWTASLMSLELENRRRLAAAERRTREASVERLLTGLPEASAVRELAALGCETTAFHVLLINTTDAADLTAHAYAVRDDALVCRNGSEVVVLVGGSQRREVRALVGSPTVEAAGLGPLVTVQELPAGLGQARAALSLALRRGSRVVDSAELGHLDLLLHLGDHDLLLTYADAVLAPLEELAARDRDRLLRTLRVFLESDATIDTAAKRLEVHRNTLRNHLGRIETLTRRRLDALTDQVELWTALQVRAVLSSADLGVSRGRPHEII